MTADNRDFDVIIIGGGPAGLAASFWCGELGLTSILFEKRPEYGGQLLRTYNPITNYLGVGPISGPSLRDLLVEHCCSTGGQMECGIAVAAADLVARHVVIADGRRFASQAMILALGVRRRKLGVEGENEFSGHGILVSGIKSLRDVTGKTVLIVGGGDAALENAVILSEAAYEVIVVHRREAFTGRAEFFDRVKRAENIRIIAPARIVKFSGRDMLDKVEIYDELTASQYSLRVDRVLVRIGVEPNSDLFRSQLQLDEQGFILSIRTDISGIFAAGDLMNPMAPTISAAVGQGAIAARAALNHISHRNRGDAHI